MGKASTGKKVARAASTGGGRTARGRTPILWYGSLALVVILGSLIIVTSRGDRAEKLDPKNQVPPRVGEHWHAAYAIDVCGLVLPPLIEDRDPAGIHTHKSQSGTSGDGIIHIHPFTSASAGKNATIGEFAEATGLRVSATTLQVPGGKKYSNGDKCDGKPGRVRLKVDGKEVKVDPEKFKFSKDRQLITLAFEPAGVQIPDPPSKVNLDNLSDVSPRPSSELPPGSAPPPLTEGSTPPGSGAPPASEAPPASTATSAPTGTAPPQ